MARGTKVMKLRAAAKKTTIKYESTKATPGVVGKYYPADDVVMAKGPTPVRNAPRVRGSITPGTVLILVAGRFRGKRVVCLKALSSGLLLVSGPYCCNGVPLRRVNQKYVIATSTKVSVAGVDVSKIDDAFFAREKGSKAEKPSAARKAAQDKIDNALKANVDKVDKLTPYLSARFTLSNNQKPHEMKF